ncbi:hypothetical protein NKK52_17515 [Mesorhizobium sp. C277A]|uniref:hypothetical protein n=1 Tax=Mesorhizobium sp. C277A TaxID=2956827 RepID=UPI0012EBF279|nr:hypothetical protein [Mesorhizobium sp. LSJC277A00]
MRKAVRIFFKSIAILDPYRALPAMVVKIHNQALHRPPDRAILRLASALARQSAREDHERQQAEKTHHESSRDLRTLLNRPSE